jgi:hypothetical protein
MATRPNCVTNRLSRHRTQSVCQCNRPRPAGEDRPITSDHAALMQAFLDQLGQQHRGYIRFLAVECDGDVVTIRGAVSSYYLWQLGHHAARVAAKECGGLLLDFQIDVLPPLCTL